MRRQTRTPSTFGRFWSLLALLPVLGFAQVPVDEQGNAYGADIEALGDEDIPRLSDFELQELVGPIALYPDDLLAVVLPASTYPLQVIEAARFLERLEVDPNLKPDENWDDSVVALLNYPEVVELLNEDLDWTWRLGEAVVAQQADVIAAVESFRDRAYAAGNLKSDEYQTVAREDGALSITPAADDVIYVPYYEPSRVVVRQARPVYYYYPRPYPVYYYPYPDSYAFDRGFFWGVTTAFTIGWSYDHLHVFHHSYHGHPYYGYRYWDRWWYRRPTINIYNNHYVRNTKVTINRYYRGDTWRPSRNSGIVRRVIRNDYYEPDGQRRAERRSGNAVRNTHVVPRDRQNTVRVRNAVTGRSDVRRGDVPRSREPITFRDRPARVSPYRETPQRTTIAQKRQRVLNEPAAPVSSRRVVTREPERRSRPQSRNAPTTVIRQAPARRAPARSEPTQRPESRQAPTRQRESRPAPVRQSESRSQAAPVKQSESRSRAAPARRDESRRQASRPRQK